MNQQNESTSCVVRQADVYEHIILSYKSYWRIREYIADNPKNWVKDKLHPDSRWKANNWRGSIE